MLRAFALFGTERRPSHPQSLSNEIFHGSVPYLILLIIAVIGAVAAYVLNDMLRDRIKIVQFGRIGTQRYSEQFVELYCSLIPDHDQTDPSGILEESLDKQNAPRTIRGCKAAMRRLPPPPYIHQLLLAVNRRNVVGFLCYMIHPSRRYAFIAYVGVPKQANTFQRPMRLMLSRTRRRLRRLGIDLIIYEIVPPVSHSTESRAKHRLFAQHATRAGLHVQSAPFTYLQPELEFSDLRNTTEVEADLCVAAPAGRLSELDGITYSSLVESIYRDIYFGYYDRREVGSEYETYISELTQLVTDQVNG